MNNRILVALPADTHSGSTVSLCPEQWDLTDGNCHYPNQAQRIINKQWDECWGLINDLRKPKSRREQRAKLIIVHVGDAVEGAHHDSTQVIPSRIDEQERMHCHLMKTKMRSVNFDKDKGDAIYYVAGTDVHVGEGARSEERIARDLEAVPYHKGFNDDDGKAVWHYLPMKIRGNLLDIQHEGPNIGTRAWTKENSLANTIKSLYFDCLETKQEIPRYFIRAHVHYNLQSTYEGRRGSITGVILPAFQAATHYIARKSVQRPSDIGMVIIEIDDEGNARHIVEKLEVSINGKVVEIED
ncbi:MAG: hypothetical protein KJ556_20545 [Gammaproteobacteria bacterium]|nr:hypothetical protein [Gammaproteobacteria bacterium]